MSKDIKWFKKPSKKLCIFIFLFAIALLILFVAGKGLLSIGGGKEIDFKQLTKDDIPKAIETEVIPEYRELERALACLVDDKIYVIVTRGEKPTAGYKVSIEKMTIGKREGKSNLKVEAKFTEPETGVSQAQVTTYPYAVSLTELNALPDTIELAIKY